MSVEWNTTKYFSMYKVDDSAYYVYVCMYVAIYVLLRVNSSVELRLL